MMKSSLSTFLIDGSRLIRVCPFLFSEANQDPDERHPRIPKEGVHLPEAQNSKRNDETNAENFQWVRQQLPFEYEYSDERCKQENCRNERSYPHREELRQPENQSEGSNLRDKRKQLFASTRCLWR